MIKFMIYRKKKRWGLREIAYMDNILFIVLKFKDFNFHNGIFFRINKNFYVEELSIDFDKRILHINDSNFILLQSRFIHDKRFFERSEYFNQLLASKPGLDFFLFNKYRDNFWLLIDFNEYILIIVMNVYSKHRFLDYITLCYENELTSELTLIEYIEKKLKFLIPHQQVGLIIKKDKLSEIFLKKEFYALRGYGIYFGINYKHINRFLSILKYKFNYMLEVLIVFDNDKHIRKKIVLRFNENFVKFYKESIVFEKERQNKLKIEAFFKGIKEGNGICLHLYKKERDLNLFKYQNFYNNMHYIRIYTRINKEFNEAKTKLQRKNLFDKLNRELKLYDNLFHILNLLKYIFFKYHFGQTKIEVIVLFRSLFFFYLKEEDKEVFFHKLVNLYGRMDMEMYYKKLDEIETDFLFIEIKRKVINWVYVLEIELIINEILRVNDILEINRVLWRWTKYFKDERNFRIGFKKLLIFYLQDLSRN